MNPIKPCRGMLMLLAVGLVPLGLSSCSSDQTERITVRHVEFAQLASNAPRPETNTYMILQKTRTTGRFPCSLAVVRVTSFQTEYVEETEDGKVQETAGPLRLMLDLPSEVRAVPWTELCDNFPSITCVKVLGRPAVTFEEVGIADLVKAGLHQHASLILIYGQDDLDDNKIRLFGALYDTMSGELVATVKSQVDPIPDLPTPPDRLKQDKRHVDPKCQTLERFQQLTLQCVYELAQLDQPSTTTQPNPWDRPDVKPMYSPWTRHHYEEILRDY